MVDGRCGVEVGTLADYARGRGFDSLHSANICVHEQVCLYWVWVFLCIICMYLHNTSLISAYFGLDSRECKCLEYLFIYLWYKTADIDPCHK
jgi:hypothetical protein